MSTDRLKVAKIGKVAKFRMPMDKGKNAVGQWSE